MSWNSQAPSQPYERGASGTHSNRAYPRNDNQKSRTYADEQEQAGKWPRSDQPRSGEENMSGPASSQMGNNYSHNVSAPSHMDTGDERSTSGTTRLGRSESDAATDRPSVASHKPDIVSSGNASAKANEMPNLKDLKAKVIASIQKPRDDRSGTPSKEQPAPHVATGSNAVELPNDGSKSHPLPTRASAGRKDSQMDIDDLLAEGKAAAEAHDEGGEGDGLANRDQRFNRQRIYKPTAELADNRPRDRGPVDTETATRRRTDDSPRETRSTHHTLRREESGPSEMGEIADDRSNAHTTSHRTDDVRRDLSLRIGGSSIMASDAPRRSYPKMDEDKQVLKREIVEISDTSPDVATPRSEMYKYRRDSVNHPTRSTSLSTHGHYLPAESSRTKDPRSAYTTLPIRGSSSAVNSARELFPRLQADEVEKEYGSRREYVTRAVDYEDNGEYRRQTATRVHPEYKEYKEVATRRLVEEQPAQSRGSVIHLSDAYWADLEEWLEMTGYHDRSFRRESLQRHRELMALELKRAALARESQAAQEERALLVVRAQSVQPRDEYGLSATRSGATALSRSVRTASVLEMPPPPPPPVIVREGKEVIRRVERADVDPASIVRPKTGFGIASTAYREEASSRVRYMEPSSAPLRDDVGLKRRYRSDEEDIDSRRPSEKLIRVDSSGRAAARGEDDLLPRAVRKPAGYEDARPREPEGNSDRRLANESAGARDEDETPRRQQREPASREKPASPPASANRDRLRSASPQPRTTSGKPGPSRYRPEENRANPDSRNETPARGAGGYTRDASPSPRKPQGESGYQSGSYYNNRNWNDSRRDDYNDRRYDDDRRGGYSQRGNYGYHAPNRGRGRGRGSYYSHRPDSRSYNHNDKHTQGSQQLDLARGGVRYFVVKSFNSTNVDRAQYENVWATQEKNAAIFSEAFAQCRHVILFFSINKSMGFQGYARMESAPGTASPPSWTEGLLWKTSGAFHIRWITIAETRFSRVGHLKNSLNDDQAVLIARDGQEVEEKCGASLCALIDEEAERLR